MTRPVVDTERLVLEPVTVALARRVSAGDVRGLRTGAGWPHEGTIVALSSALAAADAGAGDDALGWFVRRRDRGELVGECGAKGPPDGGGVVEIGYGLAPASRGQRLGAELVTGLVGHLVAQDGVRLVVAEVHPANAASRAIVERLGFRLLDSDDRRCRYALAVR